MSDLLAKLTIYRDRHDNEWVLLSSRLNTLMTSQSFLIAACAALYIKGGPDNQDYSLIISTISAVAAIICVMASLVIAINCRVILDWHTLANKLYKADTEKELKDYYIPRNQTDFRHVFTTDIFSMMLPLLFGFLWLEALNKTLSLPKIRLPEVSEPASLVWLHNLFQNHSWVISALILWLLVLSLVYFTTSLHNKKGGPSAS